MTIVLDLSHKYIYRYFQICCKNVFKTFLFLTTSPYFLLCPFCDLDTDQFYFFFFLSSSLFSFYIITITVLPTKTTQRAINRLQQDYNDMLENASTDYGEVTTNHLIVYIERRSIMKASYYCEVVNL